MTYLAAAHEIGLIKYGTLNWRETPIRASTYKSALERHWLAFAAGEWLDPETGLPHLAHLMAGCSIVLDAHACGTLIEDRSQLKPEAFKAVVEECSVKLAAFKEGWDARKVA